MLLASFVTLKAAEMVREDASRHCDLVAVSAGAGGNTSLACLVSDAVFITAKFTHETLQFCPGDINSAENNGTYRRVEHLHNDIASVQTTLDNKIELRRVDLQVLKTKNPRRYLVLSTDFGLPVNVSFLAVDAFNENIGDFVPFPSTITPRSLGVYVVTLDLQGDDDDDDDSPKIFRINVQDAAVTAHFGQVVFGRMNDDD